MKTRTLISLSILLIFTQFTTASPVVFQSPEKQVGLLELYTSEGCSSCPPADRWLSSLKDEDELWKEYIPIAFHVDYWNYIGWEDRFALPQYSERQRQYAREQSLKTVYTPGFVYNGKEWRNWFLRRYFDFPDGTNPGVLKISVDKQTAKMEFKPNIAFDNKLTIYLALLGFDLKTDVKAGENRGKQLPHDFVVLGVNSAEVKKQKGLYKMSLDIPVQKVDAPQYGLVAWLSDTHKQKPLQATGGLLPTVE